MIGKGAVAPSQTLPGGPPPTATTRTVGNPIAENPKDGLQEGVRTDGNDRTERRQRGTGRGETVRPPGRNRFAEISELRGSEERSTEPNRRSNEAFPVR